MTPEPIRFYFSFRSPYAWLASERLEEDLGDLGVPIERIAIFPTPGNFANDPAAMPDKVAYIIQDIRRLTRERGLAVRFPTAGDPDWSLSHAAFLGAERRGGGHRLLLELFRQRFAAGRDLGDDQVIAAAAAAAEIDPALALADAHDDELRAEVGDAWRRAVERDRVFGVPSFVYAGKLYWGQDRMHFVRSAVLRKSDQPPTCETTTGSTGSRQ